MSDTVLVPLAGTGNNRRNVYHAISAGGDGPACDRGFNFIEVAREEAESRDLRPCKHCTGDVDHTGPQGTALATKLERMDPDEVFG